MQNKCLKTGTASFRRTNVLVYSYFLAHAAGSGGCDNDIKSSFNGDSYKSIAFCNIRGGGIGSGGVIL